MKIMAKSKKIGHKKSGDDKKETRQAPENLIDRNIFFISTEIGRKKNQTAEKGQKNKAEEIEKTLKYQKTDQCSQET